MTKRVWQSILVLLAVSAFPMGAWAQCTFPVNTPTTPLPESGDDYEISWSAVPGATSYTYVETTDPLEEAFPPGTEKSLGANTKARFEHFATRDVTFYYLIRAYGSASRYDPICIGTASVRVDGDSNLRSFLSRGIIPVVGSAPGAYGAQFKTFLRISGQPGARGKLVFHRMNQPENSADPSMPYEFTEAVRFFEFDDVVAAMGLSGIGTLDIVPVRGDALPVVDVRVYNDAPTGIFGAAENVYLPSDVFNEDVVLQNVNYSDTRYRVNFGVRTLYSRTHAIVSVYDSTGRLRDGRAKTVNFQEPGMYMGSPEAIFGVSVFPGDRVSIQWDKPAIPFHTLTENRTNDPFIYVVGKPTNGGTDPSLFIQ